MKLLNQRKLETFKERWWNQNPEKKVCEDEDEDTGGGISIYNIGEFNVYLLNIKKGFPKSQLWEFFPHFCP